MKNIIDGEGISISEVNGRLMITNTMPNRNTFKTIKVLDDELVAKHPVDTLTLSSDENIKISLDKNNNQITFSLTTDEIKTNVNSTTISSELVTIKGNITDTNKEYSDSLTRYYKMLDSATILRNEISRIRLLDTENINELEEQLLSYDLELSALLKKCNYLSSSIQDSTATFTYNPNFKTVLLNKSLSCPFILENLTTESRNVLNNPVAGRVIFNTTDKKVQVFTGQEWVNLH